MSGSRASMNEASQTHVSSPEESVHVSATFKILLIGDACVGKTSLLCRYVNGEFKHTYVTTVGIDYKNRVLDLDDTKVKLQIWDTAGQERFRTLTNAYYRGAHEKFKQEYTRCYQTGVLIMYDITNRTSFDHVNEWMKSARQHGMVDIQIILVGHKSDRQDHRCVERREGEALAEHHDARFFEASSLTGDNCEEIFYAIADDIKNVRETSNANEHQGITVKYLGKDSAVSKQRGGCC